MSRWFRMYDEVLDDPKVQRLPAPLFKAWVNLLCLASKSGGTLPPVADIAFALRVDDEQAQAWIADLCERGLIDADRPHNWDSRQFVSDNSTERVKRFRQKKAEEAKTVSCNADETFHVTPPDTESDTDTETESKGGADAPTPLALVPGGLVFTGNVIRVDRRQFDQWRQSFRFIPDLMAALEKADAYYTDNPPKNGKWMFPVSRWLEKENGEWKERGEEKRRANDIRSF